MDAVSADATMPETREPAGGIERGAPRPAPARLWALLGLGLAGVPLYLAAYRPSGLPAYPLTFTLIFATLCALYAAACRLVLRDPGRLPRRRALLVIVAVATLYRAVFLPVTPWLSDDFYRYVWDGHIQNEGYSPWQLPPGAAALAPLRDDTYWPRINRKEQTSAYPPLAELVFRALALVQPFSMVPFKLTFLLADLLTIGLVRELLRRRGRSPLGLLVYAWHPLPPLEFVHSAHVDVLAVTFLVLALVLQARGRPAAAGVALGLATLTKLYPGLLLPAFSRRGDWRLPLATVGTVVAGFAPALLSGATNFRQLPTYLMEEGYGSGDRFFPLVLLRLVAPVPAPAYIVAVALVLLVLSLRLWSRPGTFDVPRRALWLAAAILLLVTPAYPWYFAWLLPLLAVTPVTGLLVLTGTVALIYPGWWLLAGGRALTPLVAVQYLPVYVALAWDRRRRRRPRGGEG